jgi:hypothetical protein
LIYGDFAIDRVKVNGTLEVQNSSGICCNVFYLGDKDTDGSFRFVVSGTSLVAQRRVTGAWTSNKIVAP